MQVAPQVAPIAAPVPDALVSVFTATLDRLGPFSPRPHLVVALSGGADSLALTLLAAAWAQARGGNITALTIDHGLRPESGQEAQHVHAQMQALGIAHHILTPPHIPVSNNLQETARQWRYDALADWCCAHDVLHCLIAHHAGDQRETVVLHRARGDTVDGESGMAAMRLYRHVRFLRPLLAIEKETLTDYVQVRNITWIEDPSNRNPRFARVRMRQSLTENSTARARLTHDALQQGAARAQRESQMAQLAMPMVRLHPAGYAELSFMPWAALEAPFATQLLADLLTTISGATSRPRGDDTRRLAEALRLKEKRRTLHGCEIYLKHGVIRIAREPARVAPPLLLSGKGRLYWDDRFIVSYDITLGISLQLAALQTYPTAARPKGEWPGATPAIGHLDRVVFVPHIHTAAEGLPNGAQIAIGFAPAKPLAAAPFWWLN